MKSKIGVWIDHTKAIIVSDGEQVQSVESGLEKHVRYSGRAMAEEGIAENQRDRQFTTHLNTYYDRVISLISDAQSILILGPAEAKDELEKRLQTRKLSQHIAKIETAGKMTSKQIQQKTRAYFHLL